MRAVLSLVLVLMAWPVLAADISGHPIVSDGDTLRFERTGRDIRVRLFGIDTPESKQVCRARNGSCFRCGQVATDKLRDLIDGRRVRCEPTGAVTYGRKVAICYTGRKDLNRAMLSAGWAVAYKRYLDDVPGKKQSYLAAEKRASGSDRGMWAGQFVTPNLWRKGGRLDGCE